MPPLRLTITLFFLSLAISVPCFAADDPYRPIYHYVNPEGRLNDPNGLCRWQGRWHLFFQAYPPEGWNQIMTLPRRLTLIGKDQLGIEPAGDIESLRGEHCHVDTMTLPANEEIVLEGVSGNAMELIAEIDPLRAPMIELNVLRSAGGEEVTRIMFL
jgi:sucrose-6-phosphate hydrolase SacC (GH32 family)